MEAIDRVTGPVRKIARALKIDLGAAARVGGQHLRSLAANALRATVALTAMAGVAFTGLGGGVLSVGRKFESFLASLKTAEGTADGARRAMSWIDRFAKTTPYEVDKVTAAYIALRNYGIDPTNGSLRSLGNASSAMQKDIMQAVEALADAQTGEFERLKEFGIRSRTVGEQVTFTYMKAGREVTVTARKSAAAINAAVLGIFDARFQGAMDEQSKTFDGLWSNMMDMVTSFQRQIADAGVFDFMKGELQSLLDRVNVMAANGKLEAWAKEISAGLIELLTSLKDLVSKVDWVGVIKGVIDLANGFAQFMDMIGGFRGLVDGVVAGAIGWLTTALMALGATIAGILGVAAAPIVGTIALIGLLAVAGWFIYRSWDKIVGFLGRMWNGLVDVLKGVWSSITDVFRSGAQAVWNALPAWFRTVLTGGSFLVRLATGGIASAMGGAAGDAAAGAGRPRPATPGRAANGQVDVDVRLHSDGRAPTMTARSNSPQVPVATAQHRGGNGD